MSFMTKTTKSLGLVSLVSLPLLGASLAAARRGEVEEVSANDFFMLNALDYHLNIYDLRNNKRGISRQYDEFVREFIGDILFNGDSLSVIENDRYTGHFLPLGEDKRPDTEFSLFHSLRIYKRTFQVRQFPFLDRHLPYPAIEPNSFFGRIVEPRTTTTLGIGQLYLLRLYHRTTVRDSRVFFLKVLEYEPGVKVTILWRELDYNEEP